jgi:hypothetical protein
VGDRAVIKFFVILIQVTKMRLWVR